MADFFPWVRELSLSDQRLCAREIMAAARMSADELVISELRSWSETASAIAAGLGDVRSGWLAVPKPVGAHKKAALRRTRLSS